VVARLIATWSEQNEIRLTKEKARR